MVNYPGPHGVKGLRVQKLLFLVRGIIVKKCDASAADPGGRGGTQDTCPPPIPLPYINSYLFEPHFIIITARLRCLLIPVRMNSTTVLYPGLPNK